VINTNLPPNLYRFRDISFSRSKISIFGYPLASSPPPFPTKGFPWDDLRRILPGRQC